MKKAFLPLVILFTFQVSFASNYGYLRTVVPQQNKDHDVKVTLYLNDSFLGSFSHKDSGLMPVAITVEKLNAHGASTHVSARYGDLTAKGCNFDFRIEYSFSGDFNSDRVDLGTFNAPTSAVNTYIPIGLSCNGYVNEVCSNNSSIQQQLNKARAQRLVNEYNSWKRNYDQRMRDRLAQLAKVEPANVKHEKAEDIAVGNLKDSDWQEKEDISQQTLDEKLTDSEISAEQEIDDLYKSLHEQESQVSKAEMLRIADELTQMPAVMPLGVMVNLNLALDRTIEEYLEDNRRFRDQLRERSEAGDPQAIEMYHADLDQIRDLFWIRKNVARGQLVRETVRYGARMGLGDLLDACELITQRELCDPNGRKLTTLDLISAGLGLFITNRMIWTATLTKIESDFARSVIKDAKELISPYDIKRIYMGADYSDGLILRNPNRTDNSMNYAPNTIVKYFKLRESEQFIRVYTDKQIGPWILNIGSIEGLTPEDIKRKYSLPEVPTHISLVNLPAGTEIRSGQIASIENGTPGATLYEITGNVRRDWFESERGIGNDPK